MHNVTKELGFLKCMINQYLFGVGISPSYYTLVGIMIACILLHLL